MMKEYIEREAALKLLENSLSFTENKIDLGEFRRGCIAAIRDDIEDIKHLPAADVVEVVRCKDCIYFHRYKDKDFGYCHEAGHDEDVDIPDDDFCCCGERKDEKKYE